MLYIQSRADMTLGAIEEFYNDTHQMILSSGVSSYMFTVAKNIEDAQYLVEGNYVIVTDDQGLGWKFTIMNTTQTHTEITVYCEDIGLELVNKVMDAWSAPTTKQPASYYIDKAIKDTKWKIGLNEISNLSRTLKWEGRDTSLNRLLSICTEFDHAEIEFRVQFKNLQVTNYIINIYKSRGADRSDIQLVYGDTVNDITKTSSIEELATAIMGVGSDKELPENAPQGTVPDKVTFKNLTYDDGFFFTKAGDPFLRARVANQQFNLREGYIEDYYEYDTSDPQELLNRTITQLKERSEIKVNYEVSAVKFDKSLQLGDTITIIDHDYKPELLLSGRVLELDKSYTDASQDKLVLGNFLILYSNINDKLYNLQNQIKNMKVDSNYMWLRYAKDDKGNGMTSTPTTDTQYVAILVNKKTGIPSDNPADYAGHWQLIKGNDGSDGIPGPKGEDGKTSYTHFAYADNVSGTEDFSTDDPTGRSYMGVYSDFTKADSTNPSDYVWSYTKGEAGPVGRDGAQGIPGKPGADGKTPYTHVAYADDDKGGGFSQSPDNKAYMGWYSDFTQADSNDPSQYAWSLIKGDNGETSYVHIAYADSADGADGFYVGGGTNLLTGTGNHTVTGTNNNGYLSNETTADLQTLLEGLEGQTITVSVDYQYSGFIRGGGTNRLGWEVSIATDTTVWNGAWYQPNNDSGSGRVSITFTIPKNITFVGEGMGYIQFSGSGTGTLSHLKLEKGSVATPWSPAPSEAHPVYMGTYTDFNQADSANPSDYTWSLIKGDDGVDGTSPINLVINSSNGYQFKNSIINTTFTAILYQDNKEIDSDGTKFAYIWTKTNPDGTADTAWNLAHQTSQKSITITNSDVLRRATFDCTAESLN